jgi:hypothetical protein
VSWLANLVLPELGTAQPQLVTVFFFITWSIFGFFQPFLSLNVLEHSYEKNAYKHNIVGLTAWPGSPEEGVFITYPSIEIIELKVSILLDHLLFSGLKKEQFALGKIVHGCDTHLL